MTKIYCAILFLTLGLLLSAQTQRGSDTSEQIDKLIRSAYEDGQFSGAVLVADHGKIILNKEYGFRDIEETKPLNAESVFEIASLSKQFTATLVIMLKEEGQLNIEDPITDYFPQLTYKGIKIKHLLSHTSGLSERQFFRWAGQHMKPGNIYNNDFILKYLQEQKPELAFTPGKQWEYSNLGYMLLASLLKQVSGKDYVTLLNDKILKPLQMSNSGIYSQSYKGEQMNDYVFSKVFNPKDSVFMPAFGLAWSDSLYGGVGILSNATDLLKWDQALYTEQLINHNAAAEMFSSQLLSDGSSSGYGLGWFVTEEDQVNGKSVGKRVDHYGLWPGYESSIVRYIDQKKTIIILTNQAPSVKDQLIPQISRLLF